MNSHPLAYEGENPVAGCDEAGRGCLAGPVYAAAVILPLGFTHAEINDSKKLNARKREILAAEIKRDALTYSIGVVSAEEIDKMNILRASIMAMHRALDGLKVKPHKILVDGNRFYQYDAIPHECIVGGDGKILAIAAASILAKTARDAYMLSIDARYPEYDWRHNKGYPAPKHREAIHLYGLCEHHRKTFKSGQQLMIPFENE